MPVHTAGYFGKLPSLGDFATRRLPRSFVQPWDDWLRRALPASRERLGAAWLDVYLASPFWRFVLTPGVCGPEAWMGVLMPSVDRVGRPFPLTLAQVIGGDRGLFERALGSEAWFVAAENVMLCALQPDLQLDLLDQRLLALPEVDRPSRPASPRRAGLRLEWPGPSAEARHWSPVLDTLARAAAAPWSCWSSTGSAHLPGSLLACAGLPPEDGFAALLDGDWSDRTWAHVDPPA